MKEVTLCLPVIEQSPMRVLLGLKKRGFGQGKYAGFGGKIEAGETVEAATVRELAEETGLQGEIEDLRPAGRLTFLFPARPDWNHLVHVFLLTAWRGEPRETVEMRPAWFEAGNIPYAEMWDDALYWLPLVLAGKRVDVVCWYGEDNAAVVRAEVGVRGYGRTPAWSSAS